MRSEEVLLRVKRQRNIQHEISKRKAYWIGQILCRNCFLQRLLKEVTRRRGRRFRKLLDHLKERRGYSYLKEEALDRTTWRARFGRGFGLLVRQATKRVTPHLFDVFMAKTNSKLWNQSSYEKEICHLCFLYSSCVLCFTFLPYSLELSLHLLDVLQVYTITATLTSSLLEYIYNVTN